MNYLHMYSVVFLLTYESMKDWRKKQWQKDEQGKKMKEMLFVFLTIVEYNLTENDLYNFLFIVIRPIAKDPNTLTNNL